MAAAVPSRTQAVLTQPAVSASKRKSMSDLGAAQQRWTPAVTMGLPHLGDIGWLTDPTYRRAHGKRRGRTCTAAAC